MPIVTGNGPPSSGFRECTTCSSSDRVPRRTAQLRAGQTSLESLLGAGAGRTACLFGANPQAARGIGSDPSHILGDEAADLCLLPASQQVGAHRRGQTSVWVDE